MANLLVRQCHEELNELLDLGEKMRDAQDRLAGDQLRDIARRRLEVVSALTLKARQIAHEAGEPVSDEMARELGSTLEAAFVDPVARDAVRVGRLTTALDYSGFGGIDQKPDARDRPRVAGKTRKSGRRIRGAGRGKSPDPAEPRRQAQSTLVEAQADVARATQELGIREKAAARAEKEEARLDKRIVDVEAELSWLTDKVSRAVEESVATQKLRDAAQSTLRAAEARVLRTKQELDRLEG